MKNGEIILLQVNDDKSSDVLNIQYNTMPTIEIETETNDDGSHFICEKNKSNWLPFEFTALSNVGNKIFENKIEKIMIVTDEKNIFLLSNCNLDVENGIIKFQTGTFVN